MADEKKVEEVEIPESLLVKEDEEENKEVKDTDKDNVDKKDKKVDKGESDFSLPEKFKGKSTEEIAQAYVELEKSFGRQGQEVGELRRLADNYIKASLDTYDSAKSREDEDAEFNYDEPEKAIQREVQKRIDPIERELKEQRLRSEMDRFTEKHPDFYDIGQNPEFHDWVSKSNYRVRQFEAANAVGNPDFDAADELLSSFKEHKHYETATKEVKKVEQEADTASRAEELSTVGRSSGETSQPYMKRSEIIKLRVENPREYERLLPKIRQAYMEGRVK